MIASLKHTGSNKGSHESEEQQKQHLAEEIAKIEAELEKKRLEDEIKRMEAAIAAASKKQTAAPNTPAKCPPRQKPLQQRQPYAQQPTAPGQSSWPTQQEQPPANYLQHVDDETDYVSNHEQYDSSESVYEEEEEEYDDEEEEIIEEEEETIEEEIIEEEAAPPTRPPGPAMGGLLASISQAATSREQRLEETGGKLVMQEIEPEIKEQRSTTPQLSFSMAEMITKKAKDRDKRLAEGGEKKMTKIKEKAEYKKEFSNICIDAAAMGRLTRLNEHTIEAVAGEKTPEEEWRSNGLLAIQWRSNHMAVIHEAAKAGNLAKLPEKIVSNAPDLEEDYDLDEVDMISPRMRQLLELNDQVGTGQQKVEKLVLGRKEENAGGDSMLIKPMICYSNITDVKLPKKRPPKIDPQKFKKKAQEEKDEAERSHRPLLDISHAVAEKAWERRTRLDRPGGMPKKKEKCDCPYCVDPSPYQTFAYREKERRRREEGYESPDSDEERRMARERRRMARRKQRPQRPRQQQETDSTYPNIKVEERAQQLASNIRRTTTSNGSAENTAAPRTPRVPGERPSERRVRPSERKGRPPRPRTVEGKPTPSASTPPTRDAPKPAPRPPTSPNTATADGGCACAIL